MRPIDLHTHSNRSDGSYTPTELVDYAVAKGLAAVALTDHDTIDGLSEALLHAKALTQAGEDSVEVIPGIEFSTEYKKKDIHIVGLYINYEASFFKEKIRAFVDARTIRNKKMCENLQEAGIDISYEKLQETFPGSVITRGHYAKYLFNHGYVKTMPDAFERYVGDHTKYFVPREKVTPSQAVQLIRKAKGFPVLAHPPLYHMSNGDLDTLVKSLADDGLLGIEAIYSTYQQSDERQMRSLANKYGLCISGGSDFHGGTKPGLELATGYGKLRVPEDVLLRIKTALEQANQNENLEKHL